MYRKSFLDELVNDKKNRFFFKIKYLLLTRSNIINCPRKFSATLRISCYLISWGFCFPLLIAQFAE